MTKVLNDALKKQKKSTKRELLQIAGTLGIPLDGARLVEVPNRKPYVYVKLRDNQNEVIQAYNNKVAASYGLPVIVERQGNRYVVLSVDTLRYQSDWTSFAPFLPRHGNTHSFNPETNGGADIVWVHSKQFMPALIIPSGTAGGPDVVMSAYSLKNTDGSFKYVGNTGTQNLTLYNPSTGSQAVMVLVYLDTVSGNPYLMVGSGSYFSSTITGTAGVLPYVPLDTNISHIPLAAVRLVTGTSSIGWSNIYDLRQFYYNLTGSSGGGSSSISVQDEGIPQGTVDTFNFVGVPVDVSVSGTVARVFITGSAGGSTNITGTSIGLPNKVSLTDSSGFLTTNPSLGWGITSGKGFLEFGADVPVPSGKVFNAGYVGYKLFDNDFDIVGAGTGSGDRWVRIYDNIRATHMQPGSLQIPTMTNSFVYLNATGTFVNATNTPGQAHITGSDVLLGINAATQTPFLATITTLFEDAPTVGRYTPTLTKVANIGNASVGANSFMYIRLGSMVIGSGRIVTNLTGTSPDAQLRFSLPIASDFTSTDDMHGNATNINVANQGSVTPDTTNNEGVLNLDSTIGTASNGWRLVFMYFIQ